MERVSLLVAGLVLAVAVGLRASDGASSGVSSSDVVTAYVAVVTPALVAADVAFRRLPNVLTYPGLALVALVGGSTPMIAAACIAVGALVLVGAGVLGMGDAKLGALLAAALVSALHPNEIALAAAVAVATTIAVGGAHAMAGVVWSRISRRAGPDTIAFGPALLAGFWVACAAAP